MELNEMIVKIIETTEKHNDGEYVDGVIFPDETVELIHMAAGECRKTGLYKGCRKDEPEDYKTRTASDLYIEMLVKIANAPTYIHAMGTHRLMLPAISDALKRERGEQKGNE